LFTAFVGTSIVGRAVDSRIVEIACTNYRDFTTDRHRSVDDASFGGGPGMVLMCEPIFRAVESLDRRGGRAPSIVMLTPQGERLDQKLVEELARESHLVLLCGHYEGFDERIRVGLKPREVSIGDYVLSGGENAAMVLIDAVVRVLPGALGNEAGAAEDSFSTGLLEYPQYTRPRSFRGMDVPEVLLSGNHAAIDAWRREQAVERTRHRRPDLLVGLDDAKKNND